MKNIFLALITVTTFSCKAQTPVYPIYDSNLVGDVEGAYYKDTNHFHDQFVGIWLYTNGSTSLKVVLRKKNIHPDSFGSKHFYADYLVGEYQYIENGVEKVNTLNKININYNSVFDYNLYSIDKVDTWSPPLCNDCLPGVPRLIMGFKEPTRLFPWAPYANFVIRVEIESGVTKLKAQFYQETSSSGAPSEELKKFSLPYGNYILIKQPNPGDQGG